MALFDAVDLSAPDSSTTLSAIKSSKDDISTARAATVGLGIAINEALSENAYRKVLIFENGLVIAIIQDASRADFFSTDRIDFRRFHREVAPEKAALFALKSLGSSEARSTARRPPADPSAAARRASPQRSPAAGAGPNAKGFRRLTGCGWFLFPVTAGSCPLAGMPEDGVPGRGRPGPRSGGGSFSLVFGVSAVQAGVLAMVTTAGAMRVAVSFAFACGNEEGDLDFRARCRSRSTAFRYPAISLVTAW